MIIYEDAGTSIGVEIVRIYSDAGMHIECDGVLYIEAVDPKGAVRTYTETGIPIEEEAATPEDYEDALETMGVEV